MLTIYEYLALHGGFQAFLAAAKISGFDVVLKDKRPHTIFAPTDAAFMRVPTRALDSFLGLPDHLAELLSFHALRERLALNEICRDENCMLSGKRFALTRGKFQVNGARVIGGEVECVNGVVYVIDRVLIPEKEKKR